MENLLRNVNVNKKVLMAVIVVNMLIISMYYSYALVQVNDIRDNNVVVNNGNKIDFTFASNVSGNKFTLDAGKSKTVTISLSSSETSDVKYKLYYITNGNGNVVVSSNENFNGNIVGGVMNKSKTITLTFKNTSNTGVEIFLGGHASSIDKDVVLQTYEHEIVISK